MSFISLHTHSHYSLLSALPKIPALIKKAQEYNMKAIALTDYGNLYGAIEFYKKCTDANIKPIIGVHMWIATNGTIGQKGYVGDENPPNIVLLAKNNDGYKNLLRLTTIAHTQPDTPKPQIDHETLTKHANGIICLSGTIDSELGCAIQSNKKKYAQEIIKKYKDLFKEDYYVEIMHHPRLATEPDTTNGLITIAKETNTPLVATQNAHYLTIDDQRALEVMLSIRDKTSIENETRFSMEEENYAFTEPNTIQEWFKDTPEAIENTQKIADQCSVTLELGTWTFPQLKITEGVSYDDELRRVAYEGIEKRGLTKTSKIIKRLDYELEVIKNKGFSVYFLIVGDLLAYARKNKIFTTIRGSVAGSLATYLVGITNVNPLDYKLPFERFLNPERPSAPDIDMDYADNRRDEMLDYARAKYGKEKVAQIGTFGTMAARGAVRDVSRALGHPYGLGDKIAKLIPMGSQGFPMTIERALEDEPELKELYDTDATTQEILNMAQKVENCARHISVHAAGVVISPTNLTDFVPVQFDPKGGKLITQYDMHGVEDAGLIKFDFLGIRNLAILENAVHFVKKYYNKDIDIENIPLDDPKTFSLLAKGETMGLFQLNGAGMTRHLKDLKPTTIHDINAMVALYRPGPMEMIPEYIQRKHNPSLVKYLDPRMKDILDQSHGVITYQDDVMMIAIVLAGYSWLEADKLRKAMGKKIPEEMASQKEKLHKGFLANGMTEQKAKELWQLIEPFAAYGFNKAHAASYGRVAYQTAFMKANYPTEFITAILSAESGDIEKVSEIVAECRRMDLPVLPPDINESDSDFTIIKSNNPNEKDAIRFGLSSIKNLGDAIAKAIADEQKANGHYTSLTDFLTRVTHKDLSKKSVDALAKVGALDAFCERNQVLENMDNIVNFIKQQHKEAANDQNNLFGTGLLTKPSVTLSKAKPASTMSKLMWEKELLGLYVSGHPTDQYEEYLNTVTTPINKVPHKDEEPVTIGGIIASVKKILTKKGNKQMAFVTLEDNKDKIEVLVFPKTFEETKEMWSTNRFVIVDGKVSTKDGEKKVLADVVKELSGEEVAHRARIEATRKKYMPKKPQQNQPQQEITQPTHHTITLPQSATENTIQKLSTFLKNCPQGKTKIILQSGVAKLQTPFSITLSKEVKNEIDDLLK
ncbi:MAG: DNA polymerase III subunit alpha [Candidatus Moranbacteria bacterium]|nr:DNA polymerase III subunit alpha [Candidatus Moranbacteria bacterium]